MESLAPVCAPQSVFQVRGGNKLTVESPRHHRTTGDHPCLLPLHQETPLSFSFKLLGNNGPRRKYCWATSLGVREWRFVRAIVRARLVNLQLFSRTGHQDRAFMMFFLLLLPPAILHLRLQPASNLIPASTATLHPAHPSRHPSDSSGIAHSFLKKCSSDSCFYSFC